MTQIIKSSGHLPFLILLLLVIIHSASQAQKGEWVEYSLEDFGSGTFVYDCGDGCCGYAFENSGSVLCFDVEKENWMEIDLGGNQTFQHMESSGNILFSVTDQLLFGYSSSLGEWDTLYYEGTEIPVSDWSSTGYGCSDSLAFFLSTEKFYVFDGSAGEWKGYKYDLPENFGMATYLVNDNYIAAILSRTDNEEGSLNIVYSAFTRKFIELDPGASLIPVNYNDGYAGLFDKTGFGKELLFVGYNAHKNQFILLDYSAEDESSVIFNGSNLMPADPFNAYCIGFRKVITPNKLLQIKYYGYSTSIGEWNTITYDIDLENESYDGNGTIGGVFTSDMSIMKKTEKERFFFFTSEDTSFHDVHSDIKAFTTSSGRQTGGKAFVAFDDQKGWGYNPSTRNGSYIDFSHERTTNLNSGNEFITFSRYSGDSDIMNTYFYNSRTNRWSSVELPKNAGSPGNLTSGTYLYNNWPENVVVFYSAKQDSIINPDLPDSLNFYLETNDHLAYARAPGYSMLFNGNHCSIHEKNFLLNQNGLGEGSGAFFNSVDSTLHGYSAISDNWTIEKISEEPYYALSKGYIGIVSSWLNNRSFGKFYAYNAFDDAWIELIPEGIHQGVELGQRTAMVIRSDHVYAFNPSASNVYNDQDVLVTKDIKLSQNYPNPYKEFTHIEYKLPSEAKVILKIYNTMGQEVKTLVHDTKPAGIHYVIWNGKDNHGQSPGPGIYIYQLRAGNQVRSKRMVLLSK